MFLANFIKAVKLCDLENLLFDARFLAITPVNGPCLLDYLILKLRLPVVLYVSFTVDSR